MPPFDLSLTVHALADAAVVGAAVGVAASVGVDVGVDVVVTEVADPPHAARKLAKATAQARRGSARLFTWGRSSRLRVPLTVRAAHESGSSDD